MAYTVKIKLYLKLKNNWLDKQKYPVNVTSKNAKMLCCMLSRISSNWVMQPSDEVIEFFIVDWDVGDCNGIETHNHLVRKRGLEHEVELASMAKWLSFYLPTR